ncbi:MAG: hypothetical protein Ct9H300mP27_10320 [Chloroflexota bacterium]|nr:MAG: hypothetical protein Ct9H300mP27_10320 [Chloroflexota bacterium]
MAVTFQYFCPTLIIRGTETDLLPREVATEWSKPYRRSVSEVSKAGHMVFEDNPEEFIPLLKNWLSVNRVLGGIDQ